MKAGDVLFIDKTHPEIKFTTPVSGTIEAINRGERRKLLEVVVKADAETGTGIRKNRSQQTESG